MERGADSERVSRSAATSTCTSGPKRGVVCPRGGAHERAHKRARRYGSPRASAGLRAAAGVLVVPRAVPSEPSADTVGGTATTHAPADTEKIDPVFHNYRLTIFLISLSTVTSA